MTLYNLYYGTMRINNTPLTEQQVESIRESNMPIRKRMMGGKTMDIPFKKVRVVKCTIVS